MKFLFCMLACCLSYAHSSIFIGHHGNEIAFTVEINDDFLGDSIHITDNGEIYVKVDKIIPVADPQYRSFPNNPNMLTCGSRVSQLPQKWQCPYCHVWWEMGERCTNEKCPTNQWKKDKE